MFENDLKSGEGETIFPSHNMILKVAWARKTNNHIYLNCALTVT